MTIEQLIQEVLELDAKATSIEAGRGKIILVDKKDLRQISNYKWRAKNCHHSRTHYACATIWDKANGKLKNISMHRLLLGVTDPKIHVDHINRNGLDNRRENLRLATNFENQSNKLPTKSNKSGYKGVSWCNKEKRWRATISFKKKKYRLGSYKNILLAAAAYNGAALLCQGRFAYLNPLSEVEKILEIK